MSTDKPQAPEAPADAALYRTEVTNHGGIHGTVEVSDGPSLPTGPPSPGADGYNPEQFLAMAWSTCLGATVEAVLRGHQLDPAAHPPSVTVEVELHRAEGGGYRFLPTARIHLPGLDDDVAKHLVEEAHHRCPVSRLLRGTEEVRVAVEGQGRHSETLASNAGRD